METKTVASSGAIRCLLMLMFAAGKTKDGSEIEGELLGAGLVFEENGLIRISHAGRAWMLAPENQDQITLVIKEMENNDER